MDYKTSNIKIQTSKQNVKIGIKFKFDFHIWDLGFVWRFDV